MLIAVASFCSAMLVSGVCCLSATAEGTGKVQPKSSSSANDTQASATDKSDQSDNGEEQSDAREYDDFFDNKSARSLYLAAKYDMRKHFYARAIIKLQEAVKLDPDDADVVCLYAEAMQEKLNHQADKDPKLFNRCVATWLKILRNAVGEEKGLTYKGLSLDNGLYGDDERVIRAKIELKALTGYVPKPWETNDHYLKRVLKDYNTSVTAEIKLPAKQSQDDPKQ